MVGVAVVVDGDPAADGTRPFWPDTPFFRIVPS
jgi:hypothetical protein